jgi:hypothetical protein
MRILVLGSRVLRPLDHEVGHIVDRCVLGISGLLTNVIEGLSIRHCESLRGVVRIGRHRVGCSLLADCSQRVHTPDRRELIGNLVDESGSLDGSLVAGGRVDRYDTKPPRFVPATVPTISGPVVELAFSMHTLFDS